MCSMIPQVLPFVRGDQPLSSPRQRSAHGSDSESGLRRDLRIAQARVPQQENLPVSRSQRPQCVSNRRDLLVMLHLLFGGWLKRWLGDRVTLEQSQVPPAANGGSRLVPGQVGGDREHPGARLFRPVRERPDEHLLRQIFSPLGIPYL